MKNLDLIKKAREERRKNLQVSSLVISFAGLFLGALSLIEMASSYENFDNGAYHVLFIFSLVLTFFGIFSAKDN